MHLFEEAAELLPYFFRRGRLLGRKAVHIFRHFRPVKMNFSEQDGALCGRPLEKSGQGRALKFAVGQRCKAEGTTYNLVEILGPRDA